MADKFSKETRSRIMGSIKRRSKLEDKVSKALWKTGIRFRKNDKSLYGTPDISIKTFKIVIFIDSCFWHVCPEHFKMPKSNTDFWIKKVESNIERDKRVTEYYINKGWNLMRVWEHELKKDNFHTTIDKIAHFIQTVKLNKRKV